MRVTLKTRCGCTQEIEINDSRPPLGYFVRMQLDKETPPAHLAEFPIKPTARTRLFRWNGVTDGYTKRPVFEEVSE